MAGKSKIDDLMAEDRLLYSGDESEEEMDQSKILEAMDDWDTEDWDAPEQAGSSAGRKESVPDEARRNHPVVSVSSEILNQFESLTREEKRDLVCKLKAKCDPSDRRTVARFWSKDDKSGSPAKFRKRAHIATLGVNRAAWAVPLIFAGDKIPVNGVLALDAENINLKLAKVAIPGSPGNFRKDDVHLSVPATVALVNEAGDIVLWAFISWPKSQVCQYFTGLTKLSRSDFKDGITLHVLHQLLDKCLKGNTLVGHNIFKDLDAMKYEHDRVEDLQDYPDFRDHQNQPYGLKALASTYLGEERMESFQNGEHSAIKDARVTMDMYKIREKMKYDPINFPVKPVSRPPRNPFRKTKGDFCLCHNQMFIRDERINRGKDYDPSLSYYFYRRTDVIVPVMYNNFSEAENAATTQQEDCEIDWAAE